jgi:hypothetical protein
MSAPAVGARWVISPVNFPWAFWRSDGKELYFTSTDSKLMAVEIATNPAFRAGSPRILFKIPGNVVGGDLTADGTRTLLNVRNASPFEPYWVVLNWPALLKH